MPPVQEDVHRAANLVAAVWPLQLLLSAAGLGIELPDQCCVRGLAWHTLRGYAFDLTDFIRWWAERHSTDEVTEQALTTSSLLDDMRYQAEQQPRPAPNTINKRVWVAERALRCQFPNVMPPAAPGFQQFCWRQSALGYGRSRPALTRLRVKVPKRVVTTLSVDEVSRFWSSFRTGRDLAIVGLMLLQGLRSCEVLALDQEDLILSEAQIRVRGKGSLPALMHLMGHAQIQTTMVYVRITPQDVYQQYVRAVAQLVRPALPSHS